MDPQPSAKTWPAEPDEHAADWLRALAHPVRMALTRALSQTEPRQVNELAERIGHAANLVSFHLRQLEKYGIARKVDSPTGERKGSWWVLAHPSGPVALTPSTWTGRERERNLADLFRVLTYSALDRIDALMRAVTVENEQRVGQYEFELRLTTEEAVAFMEEHKALLKRMVEASDAHAADDPGVRTWMVAHEVFPIITDDSC